VVLDCEKLNRATGTFCSRIFYYCFWKTFSVVT